MTDLLKNIFELASDFNNLDPNGLNEFKRAFNEKITSPSDVYRAGEHAVTRFFVVALACMCLVIILISAVILITMVYAKWITITTALLFFIFILFAFWLGYLVFKSIVDTELTTVMGDLNSKMGNYSEALLVDILDGLKIGMNAYVTGKKKNTKAEFEPEEIDEPVE